VSQVVPLDTPGKQVVQRLALTLGVSLSVDVNGT